MTTPPPPADASAGTDVPGLDLAAFGAWFATHGDTEVDHDDTTVWSAQLITGGKSNLTYTVSDGTHEWILRRPPLGHVQATAHDMAREYRVMSALAPTAVPVPGTVGLCTDPTVMGANFYVMEKVEGVPYRSVDELVRFSPETTARLGDTMVRVLADLHGVDPASVALSDFGRPAGFLTRQVKRWGRQLEGSRTRDLPDADALLLHLLDHVPAGDADRDARSASIVHGDYRLDNLLAVPTDDEPVKAVVDWEMSTLGDPLTDLALLLVYDRVAHMVPALGISDVADAPGYPSGAEIVEKYAQLRGLDSDAIAHSMQFHLGLAHFKLAVILEGINRRYLDGQTVGDGFATIGTAVEPLLAAGLAAARGEETL
ncbi:phosphotransferase family protein [Nocardioides yefusunii]|uniref:Phosphotransferase family protein n=1 Tax=Nocardioides yefusunii TaxID=2500546 RepID=A0ABW1QXX8_9ACTN|nr:phosphotransferase family protein [Nocardioides yefusunii]